eukprot:SM000141S00876  [mRNA]  locus=s141:171746:173213:- [translate_table: standard]
MAGAEEDDLDDILNSALDDFHKAAGPRPPSSAPEEAASSGSGWAGSLSTAAEASSAPGVAADTVAAATAGSPASAQGLGVGLPALDKKKKKTPKKPAPAVSNSDERLASTLETLAEQTRQTVESMEETNGAVDDELIEKLVRQFEDVGSSQDMQVVMDTMMRQLLSEEVLYEPMKEIGERYPAWLASNREKLSTEDYDRYSRQHHIIQQLCVIYETTPEDFPKIVDLMQQMQDCGQPPVDIVQELAPGMEMGPNGVPSFPGMAALAGGGQQDLPPNCSIM